MPNSTTRISDRIETLRDRIIEGNSRDDRLNGGRGNDSIFGRDGDDSLFGRGGNDSLFGEDDDDQLFGGDGDDSLDGGENNDELNGEDGNDSLTGGLSNDVINGGDGDDVAFTDLSIDGADTVDLGAGSDAVIVSASNSTQIRLTFTSSEVGNGSANDFEHAGQPGWRPGRAHAPGKQLRRPLHGDQPLRRRGHHLRGGRGRHLRRARPRLRRRARRPFRGRHARHVGQRQPHRDPGRPALLLQRRHGQRHRHRRHRHGFPGRRGRQRFR